MNTQIQQSSCSAQSRRLIRYREHTELLTKGKEEQTSTLTLESKYYNLFHSYSYIHIIRLPGYKRALELHYEQHILVLFDKEK